VADLVAIVGVVTGAVVALGSAVITAISTTRQERTRLRFETKRDRESELRAVADDAALKLTNAIYQLDRVLNEGNVNVGPLYEAFGQIWNYEDRLAIRLGNEAPEVTCYRTAVEQVSNAMRLLAEREGKDIDAAGRQAFDNSRQSAFVNQRKFRELISKRLSPDVT
jgi:hypothetical protein